VFTLAELKRYVCDDTEAFGVTSDIQTEGKGV